VWQTVMECLLLVSVMQLMLNVAKLLLFYNKMPRFQTANILHLVFICFLLF